MPPVYIRRRVTGPGTPPTLEPGELFYNDTGHTLEVGDRASAVQPLVTPLRQVELSGTQTIIGQKTIDVTLLKIPGGIAADVLVTDGLGNLSFTAMTGGGGGGGLDQATADGLYVNVVGDTMTGDLVLDPGADIKLSQTSGIHRNAATTNTTFNNHASGICFTNYGAAATLQSGIVASTTALNYNSANAHTFYTGGIKIFNLTTLGIQLWRSLTIYGGSVLLTLGSFTASQQAPGNDDAILTGREPNNGLIIFNVKVFDDTGTGGSDKGFGVDVISVLGATTIMPAFKTVIHPATPGLYVYGDVSALSHTTHVLRSNTHDVEELKEDEVKNAWLALKPMKLRKNNPPWPPKNNEGEPALDALPYPIPKTRYGLLADDLYSDATARNMASTKTKADGTEELVGTDIAQVVALAVAKIKQLEAQIAVLEARVP